MGRWVAGIIVMIALLLAALSASSTTNAAPQSPTLADDFSKGAIEATLTP